MEELKWNLDGLFEDVEAFYKEIDTIKKLLKGIRKYKNVSLNARLLQEMLDAKWEIKERTNKVLIFGSLMYYKDVSSEETIELKKVAEELNNEVTAELSFIDSKILELGESRIKELTKENPELELYRLSLNNLFRLENHVQSKGINSQIKDNNNSISSLLKEYNALIREIEYGTIVVDGEPVKIDASNFAKYIAARDRDTRKQTFFVVNEVFQDRTDEFANILDSLYTYRTKNATLEEYGSVLEKVLFEENISPKIIDSLIEAVRNNLPLMRRYLKIKSSLLGIENPHLYDFTVHLDFDSKRTFTIEEAINIIKEALKPLKEGYSQAIDELLKGHIDASLDERKHQSITFSWGPYSFLNFRGSYGDIKNLVHELGHSVNYLLSEKIQSFIYTDSTVFVGETASIVNEILLNRYLFQQSKTDEEKAFYLSKEIENYFTSVFKQTMYTEFEQTLYNYKKTGELSSEFISKSYMDIIQIYYGEDIEYDEIAKLEWTRLGHLYRWSYYPYKYATGLLIASTVVNSLENGNLSIDEYLSFLSSGSNQYSLDLLRMLKIDLMDSNTLDNGFNVLRNDIEELERIIEKIQKKEEQ